MIECGTIYKKSLITFILVKHLGIAFLLCSQFLVLKFTQSFQIFGHTIVYFWLKDNIFNAFEVLATAFVLLFLKLIQHMVWYIPNIYTTFIRQIWFNKSKLSV